MTGSRSPRNPNTEADRLGFLLEGLATGSASDPILNQEARGQREFLSSDVIPTNTGRTTDAELTELGFTLGPAVDGDPIFRYATLPDGWTRKATGHSMWTTIVDENGTERASVFYKAAFYDRDAHMSLTRPAE